MASVQKGVKVSKKKTARQKAKEDAWNAFSRYIRTRDCLRFTGDPTQGKCVTCNRNYPFAQLQAGHFIQGRGNAVLFDERQVYSQCIGCNGNPPYGKGGNYIEYFIFMEKEWGREKIDEFRAMKHETKIYKIYDLQAIGQEYKDKCSQLFA
jgi:hypothetical protein